MRALILSDIHGSAIAARQALSFFEKFNCDRIFLLGDTLYRSDSNKPCTLQMVESYEQYNCLMVSIHPIPLAEVSRYGILHGVWEDKHRTMLNVGTMVEKPKASYAEDFLCVRNKDGEKEYYSVFGQYILTPEVFAQLHEDIMQREIDGDHVLSYKPFSGYNTHEIQTFVEKFVIQGLKLEMKTEEYNLVESSHLPGFKPVHSQNPDAEGIPNPNPPAQR